MTKIATILLIIIFDIIAVIHFYWAAGGQRWLRSAIPTSEDGAPMMSPGAGATALVGIGLMSMSLYYIYALVGMSESAPWIIRAIGVFIPLIFLIRAVGDLRYVGFFKKVTNTHFAVNDTMYYSPLCLVIALLGFIVAFSSAS